MPGASRDPTTTIQIYLRLYTDYIFLENLSETRTEAVAMVFLQFSDLSRRMFIFFDLFLDQELIKYHYSKLSLLFFFLLLLRATDARLQWFRRFKYDWDES